MFSRKEFANVSILRFISRANFILSSDEHEKKFYNLGARCRCSSLACKVFDIRRSLFTLPFDVIGSKRTHDVYTTSSQRRCNVMTLHRRWGDVVYTSCACLEDSVQYRMYSKNYTCSKIWRSTIYYPMLCLKTAGSVTNSVDPDETPRFVASHLGLTICSGLSLRIHTVSTVVVTHHGRFLN